MSDGSEESAGYINAIIQNIEKLGGSTEGMPAAASKFVDEFNSKFEETEKAKDAFADNIAKMETDFDKTMSDIEQTMTGTVEKNGDGRRGQRSSTGDHQGLLRCHPFP